MRIDYSQHGQALILEQLITPDTPRSLVDIGAHDGITGSNSRSLVEQGWHGVLVEPLPRVFAQLQANCRRFQHVTLLQAACSDRSGTAVMSIGVDGEEGQLSSISQSSGIAPNLSGAAFEVGTLTLGDVFQAGHIEADFGALLTDTEGLDLRVLQGLHGAAQRPRIIVTEDFAETDGEKYALLSEFGYRFIGVWGADSIWTSRSHPADLTGIRLPLSRLTADWKPSGASAAGQAFFESVDRQCIVGWAFCATDRVPPLEIAIDLRRANSPQRYIFKAVRVPRPDVATRFESSTLRMSGFRACLDVLPGEYEMRVIQQEESCHSENVIERVLVP